jgi:hypothetical protein
MPKLLRHIGLLLLAGLFPATVAGQATQAVEILQTSVSLSSDVTSLDIELAGGRSLQVRLEDGLAFIDGGEVGTYEPGGALESSWRALLRGVGAGDMSEAWAAFTGLGLDGADAASAAAIRDALAPLLAGASAEMAAEVRAEAMADAAVAIQEAADAQEAAEVIAAAAAQEAANIVTQVEILEGGLDEVIAGGLVVELTEVESLARSLGRVGIAPELESFLNGDLDLPVRIVIDADEYLLREGATLDEMLILVESDAVISGTVTSNVLVAEGTLLLTESAVIEGDVIAIDATVHNEGTILGSIREAAHPAPILAPAVPRVIAGRIPSALSRVTSGLGSLAKTIALYLLFAFLGAMVVYFFRGHLETVSDTVSLSFGRSFLAGLAAEVLFFPIGLVMTLLIVTAIAVPFYVVGFGLLSLLGYVAVAHAAGENLTRRRFSWTDRMRRSNSYYYVLNGLGVLLALFAGAAITQMAYPLLGWAHDLLIASAGILTWIAATSLLGAAVLSRAGTRRTYARPRQLPELPADTLAEEIAPIERRAEARRHRRDVIDEI